MDPAHSQECAENDDSKVTAAMDSDEQANLSPPSSSLQERLPNELITIILRFLPHVHRVSHRFPESIDLIRNLSLVSKAIRAMARDVYYGENIITIQRMLLPDQLFSSPIHGSHCPIFRLPLPSIGHLIRRLDIFITVDLSTPQWGADSYIRDEMLAPDPDRDLGILCRPVNQRSRRTEWQRNMTALEKVRVVFKVNCDEVKKMVNLFVMLPRRATFDFRPETMVIEIELVHVFLESGRWCMNERAKWCKDVVVEGMETMLRLGG